MNNEIIDHTVDNILHTVSFNHFAVFEIYKDRIESFAYLLHSKNWNDIVKFHRSRSQKIVFSPVQVREVGHVHDHFLKRLKPVVNKILRAGVKEEELLFITNYHTLLDPQTVKKYFGVDLDTCFLRYFEIDAVLKHREQKHQTIDTVFNYDKKYLALFGKPRKFMRCGSLIKMHQTNMINDAVVSSLAKGIEIDASINWAREYWDVNDLKEVLHKYSKTADDITYHSNGDSETHYTGFPYDEKLYQNTFCSIIAETNDIHYENNDATVQFFITEKFARAVYNFHPFVVLSTPYFLENIKKLGYSTFDNIIDEGYDSIVDPYKRLDFALESVKSFSTDNRILDSVMYNFNHINDTYNSEYNKLKHFLGR